MTIRPATVEDVAEIIELIGDLTEYEREPRSTARVTAEGLREALFADHPIIFAHVVAAQSPARRIDGIALWYVTYSTWEGGYGLYLEDLFVRPEARGTGAGKALMQTLARLAVQRGWHRMDWAVLKWNTPAAGFYDALGAVPLKEWQGYRLSGDALTAFGT